MNQQIILKREREKEREKLNRKDINFNNKFKGVVAPPLPRNNNNNYLSIITHDVQRAPLADHSVDGLESGGEGHELAAGVVHRHSVDLIALGGESSLDREDS